MLPESSIGVCVGGCWNDWLASNGCFLPAMLAAFCGVRATILIILGAHSSNWALLAIGLSNSVGFGYTAVHRIGRQLERKPTCICCCAVYALKATVTARHPRVRRWRHG